MSIVPDSDRPALKSKADGIRDEEIADLQRRLDRLEKGIREFDRWLRQRAPMPAYPVDCPHRPYRKPAGRTVRVAPATLIYG